MDSNPFNEAPPVPDRATQHEEARQPLVPPPNKPLPSYLRNSQQYQSDAPPPVPPKPSNVPPPVPKKDSAATADMLDRRARELDERERQLNAREAHARELEAAAEKAANPRPNNWPPFLPKKMQFCHQNFEVDIPIALRSRVKMAYYHFYAVVILLVYNMFSGLVAMFSGTKYILDMILACIILVLVTCIVFFVYRRLYAASRVGSSFSYGIFLCGMILECIIDLMGAIGINGSGFLGFLNGIKLFGDDKKVGGTMCIIGGCLWSVSLIFDIFLFITVRNSFIRAGGLKAFKKQAADETGKAVVGYIREHPEEAKEAGRAVGQAAVSYARENPEVLREVGRGAVSAATESQPLLH